MSPVAEPGPVAVVATEDTALAWVRALVDRGVPAVACPFARVAPPLDEAAVATALRGRRFDLVVATSANAVRYSAAGSGGGREAAAVGPATARALEERGFRVVLVGEGGAEDLASRLAGGGPPRRALWLRGERALEAGAARLRAAGWTVEEVVAYRTAPVEAWAAVASAAASARAWVVGSPAAAEALRAALGPDRFPPPAGGAPVIAAGETTAQALRVPGRAAPLVPSGTGVDAVVAAVLEALRS